MRLAILASHPIQYQAPLFRELARRLDLVVLYAHRTTPKDQADAGFGLGFEWDIDLLGGYEHRFLENISGQPGLDHFSGCDTPSIARELVQSHFDALLVTGWHLKSFWQAIWAAKRAGIPIIVRGDSHLGTPRGLLKRVAKRLVYPPAMRVFDIALYVGVRSREYWEHYGFPKDRLVFSPHCVDNAWFARRATRAAGLACRERHGVSPSTRLLLFSGKLIPSKRPLDLLAAAAALRSAIGDLAVLVAGAGPLAEQMSSTASATGVSVIQLGFCNQTTMPEVYAAADVLVLPSDSETWGLVANEALACGRPIAVSDACGCAPDLAEDRVAGRSFPVANIELLAKSIDDLFTSPPPAEAIAAKISHYSVEAAAEGVCSALDLLASSRVRAV